MASSPSPQDTRADLEQRVRDQRDHLSNALDALMQLEQPPQDPQDINATLKVLRNTSVQLNDALQLADDLAAWCATLEASHTAGTTSDAADQQTPLSQAPAWLEPLQTWADSKQWTFSGHAPRWHVGMLSLEQVAPDIIDVWLGDRQEKIGQLPANGQTLTDYLDAFLARPVPAGFVDALQTSIRTLAGEQPAAAVLEVLDALEQHLPNALDASMPGEQTYTGEQTYNRAAFAYDIFRVKTGAFRVKTDINIRLIAASRAQKQRLWIPQDEQGRGMMCGWLAC